METVDSDAQLMQRVRDHLRPGETLGAVTLASRADERTSVGVTRAEMSPFRFRFRRPESEGAGGRRGVQGSPSSLAVGLDQHIRIVTDPRVLARTDRRLLVLARRRGLFRPAADPVPPLSLLWECPREALASASERAGRLRLAFTDGSAITLLTPATGLHSFLAG
ncbi:hypothetical protein ACIA5C_22185 [Actinoplanes sp. NPDC051343]|uniref:hypothetical protein n=1 Tax=Actinoplanes sp. NPDC051343 TaxID=3363906 RepID=UPI0037AE6560